MNFAKPKKIEYNLSGLCCNDCASILEQDVKRVKGVIDSSVDFVDKRLRVDVHPSSDAKMLKNELTSAIKTHNETVKLIDSSGITTGEKSFYLSGLDCASCAHKIERALRIQEGVKEANVDFTTQRVVIEVFDNTKLFSITQGCIEKIRELEPDVKIFLTKKDKEEEVVQNFDYKKATLIAGALIFLVGMVFDFTKPVSFGIFLSAYILVGGEIVLKAFRSIQRGDVFNENFLMSIATMGAFIIGEYPEGVAVMLFYQVGEIFQRMAVNRSRKSISDLMDIKAEFANLIVDGEVQRVGPESVEVGDILLVKPGEKVPLDAVIIKGHSSLDVSALSGESLPKDVGEGDEILSGAINKTGLLYIKTIKEFKDSAVSKILDLVQNASNKKAKTENFITKFAKYYTPFVVFFAAALAILPPLFIEGALFGDWVHRALVFLVISCPCALVISIPLSFFGGIGAASREGILIKGGNYLEALNSIDTVVFDKTGTLTKGNFKLTKIVVFGDFTKDALLELTAYVQSFSNHPIAASILNEYRGEIDQSRIVNHEEIAGFGIKSSIDGKEILVGNAKLMDKNSIKYIKCNEGGSIVYVAVDGLFAGYLMVEDEIKKDSKEAISNLRKNGIKNIIMLTGDNKSASLAKAEELGIDRVYYELLPDQKMSTLETIMQESGEGKVAFVGDGINDAPSLARADIGIAMGGVGSDAAIEAADIVLMNDEPSKLVNALQIAKKTRVVAWQNIIFALGVKAVLLTLGALGIATMWEAVFGDVGVTIIAILNAMRAMRA